MSVSLIDALRQAQGDALGALGFEPVECDYRVLASTPGWRLRDYGGASPSLLVVAAPIKRPSIWDLSPSASAVRYCLSRGLRVYLLEWTRTSYSVGDGGLDEYADRAIAACVDIIARELGAPFLMGHSLGGTFAAIFAALQPHRILGLALLGAPLCFAEGSSRFRDAVAKMGPSLLAHGSVVPGSTLSQFCAFASPEAFVWSRMVDAALSFGDPRAAEIHARIRALGPRRSCLVGPSGRSGRAMALLRGPVLSGDFADPRPIDRTVGGERSRPGGGRRGGRGGAAGVGRAVFRGDADKGRPHHRVSQRGRRRLAACRHPRRAPRLRGGMARNHRVARRRARRRALQSGRVVSFLFSTT